MEVNRDVYGFFQACYELERCVWIYQAGHILDGDLMDTFILERSGFGNKLLDGVNRADGIADGALGYFPSVADCLYDCFLVSDIIKSVKDPEDIYAVSCGHIDKLHHNIVRKI